MSKLVEVKVEVNELTLEEVKKEEIPAKA